MDGSVYPLTQQPNISPMKIILRLVFLLPVLLFLQCADDQEVMESAAQNALISAATGGTIALSDSVSLIIPAGALSEDTEIEVESLPGAAFDEFGILGAKMEPDGLVFNSPATLRLPLPADWDPNEWPAIYEAEGDRLGNFFLTGKKARITGSQGAYFAEIAVNHFSAIGAARNCHAGSINYLFKDFADAGCALAEMEEEINATCDANFEIQPYAKNGKTDEIFLTDISIQCFLNTYFNDYWALEKGAPITDDLLQTLRKLMEKHGRQVALGFATTWKDDDNNGIYEGFDHSAVLEIVNGQLKLRQSVSVNDSVILQVINKFGENNLYYPQNGELTAALLNEYRQKRSGELFEEAICGTPGCIWQQPLELRAVPYEAVRFYVSKYSLGQNPCSPGNNDFTKCEFRVEVSEIIQSTTYFDTGNTTNGQVNGTVFANNFTGSFSGNTFIGSRDAITDNSTLTSSIVVELNEARDRVTKVKVLYDFDGPAFSSERALEATNIPFVQSEGDYRVEAVTTCDHIRSFTTRTVYEDRETNLLSFDCIIGDEILQIYFYN